MSRQASSPKQSDRCAAPESKSDPFVASSPITENIARSRLLSSFIGPFCDRLISSAWQLRLPSSGSFAFQESVQVWVSVDCRSVVLHQTACIGGWTIVAVLFPTEHP